MTFKAYPIEFEIYDEEEEIAAKITANLMDSATVEITALVSAESWPELAEAIRLALIEMKLGE